MGSTDETGSGGAEQAFEELRAQVLVMRQAVEALPGEWRKNRPVDTTETLSQMLRTLKVLGEHVQAIEKHPAVRMEPAAYHAGIAAAGAKAIADAVRKLDGAAEEMESERQALKAMIGTMDGQRRQGEQLVWTGLGALILGLVISPVVARILPFGGDGYVAAFILRADRWNAGAALMKAGSPDAWQLLAAQSTLEKPNAVALSACRETAAKTKKDQHCTIVVPAP